MSSFKEVNKVGMNRNENDARCTFDDAYGEMFQYDVPGGPGCTISVDPPEAWTKNEVSSGRAWFNNYHPGHFPGGSSLRETSRPKENALPSASPSSVQQCIMETELNYAFKRQLETDAESQIHCGKETLDPRKKKRRSASTMEL